MKKVLLLPLVLLALLGAAASCGKEPAATTGNHDTPDAWQKGVRSRADMMNSLTWTPIYKVPKSFYGRKDVWFEAGTTFKGVPYSTVDSYGGFIGRDVSFYTFLSAIHNPKSAIYTLDYRQEPYNMRNASIMYGCVCTNAMAFVLGLPGYFTTGQLRGGTVPHFDLVGTRVADIRIGDALCYYIEEEQSGHVMTVYDVVRTRGGSVSKATFFESVGPISRKIDFTEEKLSAWIAEHDAGIYRLKKGLRSVFGPAPFMEKSLSGLPAFPEEICLEDGDRKSYPQGSKVRIDILGEGFTSMELSRNGAPYATYPLGETGAEGAVFDAGSGVMEFSSLPVGLYSACLVSGVRRSDPTLFEIGECNFSVRRDGESVIVSNCGTGAMPMYASVNDHSRMARLFRKTGNGEWTADNIPPEVTHCRVFFAGAYSLYKGNSVEIQ